MHGGDRDAPAPQAAPPPPPAPQITTHVTSDGPVEAPVAQGEQEVVLPKITIRREVPKVGRNDPCPCGSGKKFKNCHGA